MGKLANRLTKVFVAVDFYLHVNGLYIFNLRAGF